LIAWTNRATAVNVTAPQTTRATICRTVMMAESTSG
jgi:hypothetical protein